MFTTIGDCDLATFLNVWASMGPVTGALFMGGTASDCADDSDDRSSLDEITMPTASEDTAISRA